MKVFLRDVAKKYQRDWIFKHINLELTPGRKYAITGPNGSGKSTLIRIISASLLPTRGVVEYAAEAGPVDPDEVFRHISFSAPYLELPEEFTLYELIRFHFNFKRLLPGFELQQLAAFMHLDGAENKSIANFSTGMKQRLKLGLAMLSDTPVVLLDEPATNLDKAGFQWYRTVLERFSLERTVIICSNREEEYAFCDAVIDIEMYK